MERCNYWAGLRDENGTLIAFGYVCGTGLLHGYMEDIIVHPDHQKQGVGVALVKKLLEEAERTGLGIVTVTYASEHTEFYKKGGFTACPGGLWRK
ncbi:GNAT family N-acetyltransferase [Brevibacillus sp. MER 51]|uniref:GNAT family N-acetyltransferase n=1 Tax=Brevibacillus sp. MER 51 TaxID=2939560 RepID=UPI00204259C5|nr:GNAT family N-acetyltransferase [Brevibacillus sp. MER 51]MCM3141257.1 GNAT family N-acetyltransferase [Brevibacillus sp. MER 51]